MNNWYTYILCIIIISILYNLRGNGLEKFDSSEKDHDTILSIDRINNGYCAGTVTQCADVFKSCGKY